MADMIKKGPDKPDKKPEKRVDKKSGKPGKKSFAEVCKGIWKRLKDSFGEIKKISWPTKKEWLNHTVVVGVFIVVLMIVVGLIDTGLSALFGLLVS